MSTHFTVACALCPEVGPEIRRSAGGVGLEDPEAWEAFLIEHEWHGTLMLVHEQADLTAAIERMEGAM